MVIISDMSLDAYKSRVRREQELTKELYQLYRQFWQHVRKKPCSVREGIQAYKRTSYFINAVLWVDYEKDHYILSDLIMYDCIEKQISTSGIRDHAIRLMVEILEQIRGIELLFYKAPPIRRATTVYRGVSTHTNSMLTNIKIGDVINLHGYISTTLSLDIALRYVYNKYDESGGALMQIRLPIGTPVIMVPGAPGNKSFKDTLSYEEFIKIVEIGTDHSELLLNKNSKLRLISRGRLLLSQDIKREDMPRQRTYVKLLTFDILESHDIPFELSPEDIVDRIGQISFTLKNE